MNHHDKEEQKNYFPVAFGNYEHHFWKNWCAYFIEARVWPYDVKDRVYRADTLPICKDVVVGISGIPPAIAVKWMMSNFYPTAEDVRQVLNSERH